MYSRVYMQFSFQKGISTTAVLGSIAFIIIVGGIWYFSSPAQPETSVEEGVTTKEEAGEMENVDTQTSSQYTAEILAGSEMTPLLDFNKADYEEALASDRLVVLYFYANWCPICRVEVANALYPAFNELESENVIGFRVNYKDSDTDSTEEALAREFNVTYQHTKVFLKNGERVLKAPDSWNKERYLSEITNASS